MRKVTILLVAMLAMCRLAAAEWQWCVTVQGMTSTETGRPQEAFLWIPPTCRQVRAVMVAQQNMSEETLFEMPSFRREMERLGVALIWIAPQLDQRWDVSTGVQQAFDGMLASLARASGYVELETAPVIPVGHSAQATFPWNFAAWNPQRTLAIVSLHGDAPRTNLTGYGRDNLDWGKRNIDGIPGLMIEGEYEWWEARVNPALAFRMMYPRSCISFLCDTGRGHFDVSEETAAYLARFVEKALEYRCPDNVDAGGKPVLKPVDVTSGWLAARWSPKEGKRPEAAPYGSYKGDPHDAFWYFDREMAQATEERYRLHRGKRETFLGIMQHGTLLPYDKRSHVRMQAPFSPGKDGLSFTLKGVFTDSLRSKCIPDDGEERIHITRVCGPVRQVNDTTFVLAFYRMGMDNLRRTGDITLLAAWAGDAERKGTVQEITVRVSYPLTEGRRQCILFPGLDDVERGTETVELRAVSDCGLPVSYYVKEGPAEVSGGRLMLTSLPPRACFPVKVTVVAWQYGIAGEVQTAVPVERSFYVR